MKKYFLGGICGILNGLFGSGGGVAAVPLLESCGLEARKSHATSVALIFVLSLVTTAVFAFKGALDFSSAAAYIPSGLAGSLVGSIILKKIDNTLLRRIFGAIIIVSAIRIFFV